VTRAARRRGIASALIGRSLAAARADGCDITTLEVDAESPTGAPGLYERMGFATLSTSITVIKNLRAQ
jgi:ribosomal protein S18 acetylase RimI-like enzyme